MCIRDSQKIEFARKRQRDQQDRGEHDQGQRRVAGLRQITHQPEEHAAQAIVGSDGQHQRDDGTAAGGDDDAGQQQARLRPAAVAMRQAKHQEHGLSLIHI